MRQWMTCCVLFVSMAAPVFSDDTNPRFSFGPKLGVGSAGVPGLGPGGTTAVLDLGAVFARPVSRTESLFFGIEYQRARDVSYANEPLARYTMGLMSAFVGIKTSFLPESRVRPYLGASLGVTRWSGRPGDTGVTPTFGPRVGTEVTLRSRDRVFAEVGFRVGPRDVPGSVPHWSLGLGYTRGF